MALINKLTAIANAIRSKTGGTAPLSLEEMASAISNLKTTFKTQSKTATPTKATQNISPDSTYDGLSKVTVNPIPAEYIVPTGSETKTENGTYDVKSLAEIIVKVTGSGGLPEGFKAIATGTHTLASAVAGGSTFTVNHNLGETPDIFIFFADTNVATTYSMLAVMRSTMFGWRSTSYLNKAFYHGNSTTTVTGADVTTSYGIKTLNATQAVITTYSSSGSYYWRARTYRWIAIKFA